jgi:hypothetical protein
MVQVVGIDYGFVHCVGAGNAAAILPNDKQAYRCDPIGVVAKERLPDGGSCALPLRAQSTILPSYAHWTSYAGTLTEPVNRTARVLVFFGNAVDRFSKGVLQC